MGDVKLFKLNNEIAYELYGESMAIEKSLQTVIENNSENLLGISFLASEYSTGKKHAGRIDTLGIDENYSPVILEYKRATNENVINQGLFYLDWLMDHKAEFELLVMKKLNTNYADKIDWQTPRLLCIAGGFTKYDAHAVQQINRNIELYRYKQFEENLFMLDLVNTSTLHREKTIINKKTNPDFDKNTSIISENINKANQQINDLYNEIYNYLLALSDDVQVKELKFYIAFKRIKNFACIEVLPFQNKILLYIKVNLDCVKLEKGFTRDVTNIGHYGTGNLSITIKNNNDFEKAKPYILESYNNN
ncbi:transporter [Staphylococcus cohnii subsp. cohnii]|nr:transporter [Staphylococcus cohnii subsp. cohnii]